MIVVWFSCGVASAVAAKFTLEAYENVRIVNSPVIEEHPDNLRFLKDVQEWLGVPIETAINSKFPSCSASDVWKHHRYMSGVLGARCTKDLKKEARYQWEREHNPEWHVLGFTVDEQDRFARFIQNERDNVLPILIERGLTKQDCYDIIKWCAIEPPAMYALGYPNANCIGCVKATSPTYWNHVRKVHPEVFASRATQSKEIGCKLVRVKNEMIFLNDLKTTDKGRSMKSMKIDCGVFCEESPLALQDSAKETK